MAENLNYNSGESLSNENNNAFGSIYGRFYSFNTRKVVCPTGWHLSSRDEWEKLITYFGRKEIAGGKVKAVTGWANPNSATTHKSEFSA